MDDESRAEDGMIEIADPSQEVAVVGAEPPPRVVIEYRDRGVPWMLVPPLLVLSAVIAVVVTPSLRPEPEPIAARDSDRPVGPEVAPASSRPVAEAAPAPPPAAAVVASAPAPAPSAPAIASPEPTPPVEPEPAPPPPFPRVLGLGFDPNGLSEEIVADAPVDPAVAMAGQKPAPAEARPAAGAAGAVGDDQPADVDPEVLPPDPKLALQLRLRRASEARAKANTERAQFHAELAAICRSQGRKAAPAIHELCLQYGNAVDPSIESQARKLLGETGLAVGANRSVRINLLRAQGYPEPAILDDIFNQDMRWIAKGQDLSRAIRGGPSSKEEVLCSAAALLLNNPPRKVATPATTRPASEIREESPARSSFGGSPAGR